MIIYYTERFRSTLLFRNRKRNLSYLSLGGQYDILHIIRVVEYDILRNRMPFEYDKLALYRISSNWKCRRGDILSDFKRSNPAFYRSLTGCILHFIGIRIFLLSLYQRYRSQT